MLGLIEFAIRLCIRFGALIGVVLLAVLLVWALVSLARIGLRPSAAGALWGACALAALVGVAWLSSGARESAAHFAEALRARDKAAPAPSGPFVVGAATLSLGAPDNVRIWYPEDGAARGARRLILFAPGLGGDRNQCALLLAELASHGYVVLAFDDMSQTPAPAHESEEARFLREGPNDYSSRAAFDRTTIARDTRAEIQAHEAIELLDRFTLVANNADTPWRGRVDTSQIGFLGYSFGGSTGAEAALLDRRIVALANLDGGLYAHAREAGTVAIPYLLMLSDMHMRLPVPERIRRNFEYMQIDRELAAAAAQASAPHSEVMEVRLSEHAMFADDYFEREHFRQWLTVPPQRAQDIARSHLVRFFAQYLPASGAAAQAQPEPRFDEVLELGGAA